MGTDYQSSYTVEIDGTPVSTVMLWADHGRMKGAALAAQIDVPIDVIKDAGRRLHKWVAKVTEKSLPQLGSVPDIPAEFKLNNGGTSLTMTFESGSLQRTVTVTRTDGALLVSVDASDAYDVDLRTWFLLQLAWEELFRSAQVRL